MSYDKQTWANGDVITAEKMNHIESGIEDADGEGSVNVFIVHFNKQDGEFVADKTTAEANSALEEGKVVIGIINTGDSLNYVYQMFLYSSVNGWEGHITFLNYDATAIMKKSLLWFAYNESVSFSEQAKSLT